MSKKHKGAICVYCADATSTTADHVFAREFFLPEHRANLPKVPACSACNQAKSRVEHYLTAILPFGGRHAAATKSLQELVPKRLARNEKLRRELATGWGRVWNREGLLHFPVATLPLSSGYIEEFFSFIVRGLLWHHWKTMLTAHDSVDVTVLTKAGEQFFEESIFRLRAANRITENLGSGTIRYEGIQAAAPPQVSAWRFSLYGGIQFGDPSDPGIPGSVVGAFTGRTSSEA